MEIGTLYTLCFVICGIFLSSCEGEANLGRLKVEGIPDIYFQLWQEREFDKATAITYQIYYGPRPITPRKFLLGTDTYEVNTHHFKAKSIDSIIYVTFYSKEEICAIYDLRTGKGHPGLEKNWNSSYKVANELLKELQEHNSSFVGTWAN